MAEVEWGRRPSNGTEGDIQRAWTCDGCAADHDWHLHFEGGPEPSSSCPIIMDALVGDHSYPNSDGPPQWGHGNGRWYCKDFVPCSHAEGDELTEAI